MSNIFSRLRTLFIQVSIGLLFLEIGSYFATKYELLLVNSTPRIYSKNFNHPDILRGRTERDAFGAWHVKNSTYRQSSNCFDITMSFNELGARDSSFNLAGDDSIILLGDSFAEGYGVSLEHTSQYLLEKKIRKQVLNFGASGSFGPLQELILYKEFKEKVSHSGLIIFILPANDFEDNDKNIWSLIDKTRYRPYFGDGQEILKPFYFKEAIKRDMFDDPRGLRSLVKDHFWLSNSIRTVLLILRNDTVSNLGAQPRSKSYYYEAKEKHQIQLVTAYKKIVELADKKDTLFVVIPSAADIENFKNTSKKYLYKKQHWFSELNNLTSAKDQRVELLDLLDYLPNETENLFLPCDSHWSTDGNIWAANTIHEFISNKKLF
ncbi:SGNH/GDSL hydrolase family protein [Gammaproteobacteria bacterium]|jgi:hypothetical protein|nr:SGNH/GDSL hydrolase family protein [Gammaproteobacteria bacterium]